MAEQAPIDIRLEHVEKVFETRSKQREDVTALHDINLCVTKGEIYCLVGPSGCGKSTVLNIVAGFDAASAGLVEVGGKPVAAPAPERAVVFQQPTLFPWLTVRQNITFGPRMRGFDRARTDEQCAHYVKAVGLEGFENHYVYELSGGMQQRTAIARSLMNEPEVLLMDEPFGALDSQTRVVMQELLMDIWQESAATILFITHDVEEAVFLGDRVGVMTRRPGRMKREIQVDIRRPRSVDDITSDHFVAIRKDIIDLIREESFVR